MWFWNDDKKWNFLNICVKMSNTEFLPFFVDKTTAKEFCSELEKYWNKNSNKVFWLSSTLIHFPDIEIPYGIWTDSGLGLLKFLNKIKSDNSKLYYKPGWVLKAYPDFPVFLYNALRESNWMERDEFKNFN